MRRTGFDVVRYPHPGSLGAHLIHLFDRLEITTVLDVGAHEGEYARFVRQLGFRGGIHSFEPVPEAFSRLVERMRDDRAWTGYPDALGARDGEAELRVMHAGVFSSMFAPSPYARERFGDAARVEATIRVPVRRLETVFRDALPEALADGGVFLKLDTQGSEIEILDGAGDRLDDVAALQVELPLKSVYEEVIPLWEVLPRLRELGFEPTGMFPVSFDRRDLTLIEVDCVAARPVRGAARE